MKISLILEHRFERTPDGRIWTQIAFTNTDWHSYLEMFDGINVIARIEDVDKVDDDRKLSSGPNVNFVPLPYFIGPEQFLPKAVVVEKVVREALKDKSAVLLRVPGILGEIAYKVLRRTGQPYGVMVVGDPYEVFARGAVKHPLRPAFQWWFTRQMQIQCRDATVINYVTRSALQKRYPSQAAFSSSFSDVKLFEHHFITEPLTAWEGLGTEERPCRLVLVGSLAQMYKSPDVVIQAVSICTQQNLNLYLTIVGDGKHRAELEEMACRFGVEDRVTFTGQLASGEAVQKELDSADLFVLPSRTEGLPRAMLEAMARGLPCIGSTVGGIPELLPATDLVPPGNAVALAQKLQEVITSPQRLEQMSQGNLETARSYSHDLLQDERKAFYTYLASVTANWQGATEGQPVTE